MFTCSPESIDQGVRQIKRWLFAAKQDRNLGVALLHVNYAVGNIDMLIQMVPYEQVKKTTGVDMFLLHKKATALQDKIQSRILRIYPKFR